MIDQFAEEVKVWKECWVKWEGDEKVGEQKAVVEVVGGAKIADVEEKTRKMPGAYEW